MSYKQFLARMLSSLLPLLGFSTIACAQQSSMPPKSEDRPLEDRITSIKRAQRDTWQKPDEVVKALDLKNHHIVADIGAGMAILQLFRA
jgi:hypothetical protein